MTAADVDLSGAAAMIRELESLPGVLAEVAIGDGLAAAAEEIRRAARRSDAFEDRTGGLRLSLAARRGRRRYRPSALVLTRGPAGAHGHLVEFGTGPRVVRKTGRSAGRMPARPFLAPAARAAGDAPLRAFAAGLRENFRRVEREMKGERKAGAKTRRALAA